MKGDYWFRPEDGYDTPEKRAAALTAAVRSTTTLKYELSKIKSKLGEIECKTHTYPEG